MGSGEKWREIKAPTNDVTHLPGSESGLLVDQNAVGRPLAKSALQVEIMNFRNLIASTVLMTFEW